MRGGRRGPISDEETDTMVLQVSVYMYFVGIYYKVLSKTEPKRMDRIEGT